MGDSSSQLLSLLQKYNKFHICQVFLQEMFCNSCIKNKKLIKQKVRVIALESVKKYVLWR